MLVLSRKLREKIVVPQCQLSVAIVGIQGSTVRLGISAPPEVAVHREELWREIHAIGADVGEAETTSDSLDAFAAELSDAAYQVALRNGPVDSWIDLELGLWRALSTKVKNATRRITRAPRRPEIEAIADQPVCLPR
ncbi:MAG TPA: carbon storage regulator [Pirellulales bacterium]|nr:carbon storage regulator [Pirellulales bacterium]